MNKIIYRLLAIECVFMIVDAALKTKVIFSIIMPDDQLLKIFLSSMALLMTLGMIYLLVYFWRRSNR